MISNGDTAAAATVVAVVAAAAVELRSCMLLHNAVHSSFLANAPSSLAKDLVADLGNGFAVLRDSIDAVEHLSSRIGCWRSEPADNDLRAERTAPASHRNFLLVAHSDFPSS